ncbi:nucleoside deaminase [Lysobacter enzymogenes]|nr:nucleoside deaminase [Lysobacter enzymogenes]
MFTQAELALPDWIDAAVDRSRRYLSDEDQVALAVDLSRRNLAQRTGGPFGAAVFDIHGHVVAVGVDCAAAQDCPMAHAETMAFLCAQRTIRHSRLGGMAGKTLAVSAQPCGMCCGASVLAGIGTMLIGARRQDVVRLAGIDDGPVPADWAEELQRRGIVVRRDIHREAACEVLRQYGESGAAR